MIKKLLITSVLAGCMSVGCAFEKIKMDGNVMLHGMTGNFSHQALMELCVEPLFTEYDEETVLLGKLWYACDKEKTGEVLLGVFTNDGGKDYYILSDKELCGEDFIENTPEFVQLQTDKEGHAYHGSIDAGDYDESVCQ